MITEKDIADTLNEEDVLHRVNCPDCSASFSVPLSWAGKKVKCKKCKKKFSVPYPDVGSYEIQESPLVTQEDPILLPGVTQEEDSILLPGVVSENKGTSIKDELMWGQKLNIAIVMFLILNLAAAIAHVVEAISLESLAWISSTLWVMIICYACASFGRAVTGYLKIIAESSVGTGK